MNSLSVLGSTGSIGCNVLKVVETFPRELTVRALAAKSNLELLARQIEQFRPAVAVVYDEFCTVKPVMWPPRHLTRWILP